MDKRQEIKQYFPPLFPVVLFFILGIVFGYFVKINFSLLVFSVIITIILLVFNLNRERFSFYLILFLSFFIGTIHFKNKNFLPISDISHLLREKHSKVSLKIKVSSLPDEFNWGRRVDFFGRVLALRDKDKWIFTTGRIKVSVYGEKPGFGDILLCEGYFIKVRNRLSGKNQKPPLIFRSNKTTIIKKSKHPFKYISYTKRILRRIIMRSLPYPHQAILSALILGERQLIPKAIRDNFIRTGTVHVLAISGLHVGMILYIFYLFLKLLRFPRKISYFILIIFVCFYALLTGNNAPVMRASIMAIAYLIGLILDREGDILNSLAFSCWLILLIDPNYLFKVGFQLSFLVVLTIIAFTPFIERLFFKEERKNSLTLLRIKKYFFRLLAVSLSAWLGSLGLVGYYFKIINPIAVLANVLVVPLAFLILATGFIFILSPPFLRGPFAYANLLCIDFLLKGIGFLGKLPGGAVFTHFFSFPRVFFYYFCLGIVFLGIKLRVFYTGRRQNFSS